MAQHTQLSWSELRVGLFVLVGLAVLGVGIFYVTGATTFGPKYRLKTFLPEVAGLTTGAPVRLDGVEIGNVEAISIAPRPAGQAPDTSRNIEVRFRVDKNYQRYILTDSTASLVTEGLLGNRYVNITRGVTGVQLKDNDEVKGSEEKAIKQVVERSAELLTDLSALSQDVRDLFAGVKEGRGTLGKFLTDEALYAHLNSASSKVDQMVAGIQRGEGSLGKLVATDELYSKVNSGADRFNDILAAIRDQKGTLGKFIYDPSLHETTKQMLDKGNLLLADVRAGKGSLGKLATDETLYNRWRDIGTNLANASAKLNDNTTTAGKMFSDPKLYDNLASLSGELRLLVGDIRQNPKKFLRIKLGLF
ncbi:MAG TPA: MlaD family protein [Methylomirabilota bacterium]|nr:MlaD family protein [Methylomirabilota bacterium]